ncbi:MAG: SIMPL domain-containing protein [Acidobacteria bacterium]|nr:SIMPL domain-containing protein [Acidobacteriota bacterium]
MRKSIIRLALLAATASTGSAQEMPRIPLILVTGEAHLNASPDLAIANLGVATQAKTVAEAREQNALRMQAVLEAVRKAGVLPQNISTTHFSVTPQYDYQEKRNPPRIAGYHVGNQITVKLEAIEKISDVLDAALAAGANNVSSLDFTLKDPKKLRIAAYDEAVKDARSKAQALAQAAGVQLGAIHLMRESGGAPMPIRREIGLVAASMAKPETPIESGEITVQVNVEIQFEIRQ